MRQRLHRLRYPWVTGPGDCPTLALTGYEQIRSVVAELAGDHEAAARVELALPETGVCGGSGLLTATRPRVDLLAGTIGLRPGSGTATTGTC